MSKTLKNKITHMGIHPFLFGVFFIISLFLNNIRALSINEIIVPLIFSIGLIGGIWVLFNFIFKNKFHASLLLSLFVIVFFSYGHTYLEIDHFIINDIDVGRHSILLIPFVSLLLIGTLFLIKTQKKLDNVTIITNTVSFALVLIVLLNIGMFNLENNFEISSDKNFDSPLTVDFIEDLPDIYYIILDGYPGYHSLKLSGYDNNEFYNYFEEHNFSASKNSFSNYRQTYLSIPSALNMEYLHPLAVQDNSQYPRPLHILGNENKLMSFFQSHGYQVVNFDSGWSFSRDMKYANLQLCGDNQFMNSEFIIMLTKTSLLNPIYVKFFENDKVQMKLCVFEELPKINNRVNEPVFVFAHMLLPHPPYLFGPNGEILPPKNLDLESDLDESESLYLDQVTFANKKIISVVDQLLDSPNPPIIVIQSDHGSSFLMDKSDWDTPDNEMLLERMNNINFIYLPSNSDIIYEGITPVNTFRIILNQYFGTNMEVLEDKSYIFNGTDFEDVTYKLKNMVD
jgi:hypothetical protein